MKQHFIAHSKTGGKKCELCFFGKFQVAKVPTCFDISMNGKAMVFVVFHCTRCGHWYWPLPSIESLIFFVVGEVLKQCHMSIFGH
jgi:hypothetical protein